jgi:two-component system response regulator GlrR
MSEPIADILVVDDDPDLRQLLSLRLSAAGYKVSVAESGEEALAQIGMERPDLVISDLRMDGMDGLELFSRIHGAMPTLPVIILTAHGTIPEAVDATRRGVHSFLTKPFDPKELLAQVEQVLGLGRSSGNTSTASWRAGIVTHSSAMEELLSRAELIATSDASVLILGQSGTGKELLARALHNASRRNEGPFIAVNCAALPENLLESELFGHVKGAFTGAVSSHKGLFRAAEGGTLLLDEIGDMPLGLQVKLLRVLQERKIRPIGATADEPVDVRILSATHRDLDQLVAEGRFRQDLYYRLNVVTLTIPSLAERREDIPLLVAHFLPMLAERYDRPARVLAPEAMAALVNAAWPGNVRQLLNVVEQAVALSTTAMVPPTLIDQVLRVGEGGLVPLDEAKRSFERDYVVRLLKMTAGNVSQAARLAGRNRTEFYKILQRHRLSPTQFKGAGEQ